MIKVETVYAADRDHTEICIEIDNIFSITLAGNSKRQEYTTRCNSANQWEYVAAGKIFDDMTSGIDITSKNYLFGFRILVQRLNEGG
jgi:hypothetical protein